MPNRENVRAHVAQQVASYRVSGRRAGRPGQKRSRRRRRLAVAIAQGVVVVVMSGSPAAAFADWTLQASPPDPRGQLQGVSCTRTSCVAAGSYYGIDGSTITIAQRWDGQNWSVQPTPGLGGSGADGSQLNAVACSSNTRCIAVGGNIWGSSAGESYTPLGEEWNGVRWSVTPIHDTSLTRIHVTGNLSAVACPSAQMCVAVGNDTFVADYFTPTRPFAERFDGRVWSTQKIASVRGWKEPTLSDVSCASARSCVAVGGYYYGRGCSLEGGTCPEAGLAERWNGDEWVVQPGPRPRGARVVQLDHVSCASTSTCFVTGSILVSRTPWRWASFAARWTGRSWVVSALPGTGGMTGLRCLSRTACIAIGNTVDKARGLVPFADRWNGRTWTMELLPSPAGAREATVAAVSCLSSKACVAVGRFIDTAGQQMTLAEAYHAAS